MFLLNGFILLYIILHFNKTSLHGERERGEREREGRGGKRGRGGERMRGGEGTEELTFLLVQVLPCPLYSPYLINIKKRREEMK